MSDTSDIRKICALIGPTLESYNRSFHLLPYNIQYTRHANELNVKTTTTSTHRYSSQAFIAVFTDNIEDAHAVRDHGIGAPIFLLNPHLSATARQGLASRGIIFLENLPNTSGIYALIQTANTSQAFGRNSPLITELTIGEKAYFFDWSNRIVRRDDGSRRHLTFKERDIILHLFNSDRPVTSKGLMRSIWRYEAGVTTHTVETHIFRLRKAFEGFFDIDQSTLQKDRRQAFLRTVEGGYQLNISQAQVRNFFGVPIEDFTQVAAQALTRVQESPVRGSGAGPLPGKPLASPVR